MATIEVRTCDYRGGSSCTRPATTWTLWAAGEQQAQELDLCEVHAKPLLALLEWARVVDLPTKPRARMVPTKLRSTQATAHLKRKEKGSGTATEGA